MSLAFKTKYLTTEHPINSGLRVITIFARIRNNIGSFPEFAVNPPSRHDFSCLNNN